MIANRIGICGLIGSGKSHVARLIALERGYLYINCDQLFKEKVLTNGQYRCELSKFGKIIGVNPFNQLNYNSKELSELLFSDLQAQYRFPILRALNEFNAPYIKSAIMEAMHFHEKTILEMATLPSAVAAPANLDAVIMVLGDGWSSSFSHMRNHVERIYNRDGRDNKTTMNLLKYQERELRPFTNNQNGVFSLNNMNVESEDEDLAEQYMSDAEILEQFDEILKSANALHYVGKQY